MAAIGLLLRRLGIVNEAFLSKGNRVVFLVFLPSMLFASIYGSELGESFDLGFIIFVAAWTILSFLAIWALSLLLIKDRNVISAFVQGSCRSNVGALAVPLAFSVLGDGAVKSVLALAVLIPIYNIMCIVLLAVYNKKEDKQMSIAGVLVSIAKNPSIISIALGIAFSLIGISLPTFINSTINSFAQVTVPLVLVLLGASITFKSIDGKFKYAIYSGLIKVVAMPVAVTLLAYLFGFRGNDLAILMLLNGVPTAIAGYVMVTEMGGDSDVASSNIMLTTILSAFTLAIFIFVFALLGIIVN